MISSYKEISATVLEVNSKRVDPNLIYNHEVNYNTYDVMKRLIDILLSLIGLIALSPFLIVIAFAIKCESKGGSVFYSQDRVGLNGKVFRMYKFRSMIPNADDLLVALQTNNEVSGHMFKMKNDPRVTKVGAFIRKTSIDEFPQLFNVLRGEMSLVGPRPPLVREYVNYSEFHKSRMFVKPGCTGIWQATLRNSVGFEEMFYLDMVYIQKRNLKLDFVIILLTVKSIFTFKGV